MQHFARSLRTLVANNQAKLALAVLNDFLPAQMPHLHDAVLLLQANLTQAERDFTTGVATRSEVQQHLAKVNAGLLNIIGEIASP
jgi:Effector-associated domain 11